MIGIVVAWSVAHGENQRRKTAENSNCLQLLIDSVIDLSSWQSISELEVRLQIRMVLY